MTDEEKTIMDALHEPHMVFQHEFAAAMSTLKEEQPMLDLNEQFAVQEEIKIESKARQMTLDASIGEKAETSEAFKKLQALARAGDDEDD